jgi:hypothetical protein
MSTVAKVFVVLNLLLAVAFLGSAATILGNQDAYKSKLESERTLHAGTIAEKDRALTEAHNREVELSRQINEARAQAQAARAEADARKAANDQMAAENAKLAAAYEASARALLVANNTIKEIRSQIEALQNERTTLIQKVQTAEKNAADAVSVQNKLELDMENATAQLQDLKAKLNAAEEETRQLRFSVETSQRTGTPASAGQQPAHRAKVLAADNEMNIVVISLGAEDGVKVGFRYTISRGNRYVGTLVIDKTEAKLASGHLDRGLSTGPVNVGDDAMNAQ